MRRDRFDSRLPAAVSLTAMPLRVRKSVAALCLALAVFAVCVPSVVSESPLAVISAAWQLLPPVDDARLPAVARCIGAEQLLARLSHDPSRAPPTA